MNNSLHKIPEKEIPLSPMTLIIGEWKELFTEYELQVLLAEALNLTLHEKEFHGSLAGYLITKRRLCLVLHISRPHIKKLINHFQDNVRILIHEHFDGIRRRLLKDEAKKKSVHEHDLINHLFAFFPLYNDDLVALLIGEKINLPYYSPHVARMEDRIGSYTFCSALDYAGGKSPVRVKLLTKHEKEKHRKGIH